MAQDFHAAFGLGVSDKLIDTIDPDGVVLATIQGLHNQMETLRTDKDAEIAAMQADLGRCCVNRNGSTDTPPPPESDSDRH